jgi:hypothetical protein
LGRELGISRALLARWKSLITSGAETAVRANEPVVPASELKVAQQQIRELQRLLGKKEVELEILRAARDEVKKKTTLLRRVQEVTRRPMATICRYLAVGRAVAYRSGRTRPARYQRRDDPVVYAQLKAVLRERGSYGYRRATVLVNRDFAAGYNRKRIQRVMGLTGLALAVRRRSANRRPHRGVVAVPLSNQRWCSDVWRSPAGAANWWRRRSRSIARIARYWRWKRVLAR